MKIEVNGIELNKSQAEKLKELLHSIYYNWHAKADETFTIEQIAGFNKLHNIIAEKLDEYKKK